MNKSFVVTFVFAFFIFNISARTMTRCQLVTELIHQGFPDNQIPDWVCLVENESARNTSAIGGPNSNGSYDYGLFQINGKYWCAKGEDGGDCNMKCEDLIDDDITDDCKCSLEKIFPRHGFSAWHGWEKRCKNQTLPDVTDCLNEVALQC